MANIKSQKKRNRQNEKNKLRNIPVRSSIRTANKKVLRAIDSKESTDSAVASEMLLKFIKTIDKAASKGIVNKKAAARKKSRLTRQVNQFVQQQS
ncbi:MAG: 30S ribosomal protein S20 [bacterium]|nr:30S ribosomal protein S20 [bacterium]